MTEIPIVDISAAVNGDDVGELVATLRGVMEDVGFLQITGHGIPPSMIDAVHDTMQAMDEFSAEERAGVVRPRAESRGIFERFGDDGTLLQWGYQFIPYDDVDDAERAGAVRGHPDYFTPNVWPDGRPEMRQTWKEYARAARELSAVLMSLFAQALGLDADHFVDIFAHDVSLLSANWYPNQPLHHGDGTVMLKAHPDSGVLAVLHQRGDYDGLQVLANDGSWMTVPRRDDAFVINIGHLMSRWTNGRWPATVHRVLAADNPTMRRESVAVFFLPNIDHVIAPLPSTVGAEGPRYDPISTYDWQHHFMTEYVLATNS